MGLVCDRQTSKTTTAARKERNRPGTALLLILANVPGIKGGGERGFMEKQSDGSWIRSEPTPLPSAAKTSVMSGGLHVHAHTHARLLLLLPSHHDGAGRGCSDPGLPPAEHIQLTLLKLRLVLTQTLQGDKETLQT